MRRTDAADIEARGSQRRIGIGMDRIDWGEMGGTHTTKADDDDKRRRKRLGLARGQAWEAMRTPAEQETKRRWGGGGGGG